MVDPVITTYAYVALEVRSNFTFIIVRIMKREDASRYPLNFSYGGFGDDPALFLADLELCGHFSSIDGRFIAFDEALYNGHSIDLRRAKAMVKMLTKINKEIIKSEAREPGDVFMAFCKATGVSGAVIRTAGSPSGSHSDSRWQFTSVAAGRDQLRRLIIENEKVA